MIAIAVFAAVLTTTREIFVEGYSHYGFYRLAILSFINTLKLCSLLAVLAELSAWTMVWLANLVLNQGERAAGTRATLRLYWFFAALILYWANLQPWFPASSLTGAGRNWNLLALVVFGVLGGAILLLSTAKGWQRAIKKAAQWWLLRWSAPLAIGVAGAVLIALFAMNRGVGGGPPLVIVCMDTLRWDHVGALSGKEGDSPHMDALAKEGVLFVNAVAQASWTLPSHMSLFTGQYPSRHGVITKHTKLNKSQSAMLAEILRDRGYRTAAFVNGGFLRKEYGFGRGFESFKIGSAGRFPQEISEWLEEVRSAPFLLFVQNYGIHNYWAPEELFEEAGIEIRPELSTLRQIISLLIEYRDKPLPEPQRLDEIAHLQDRYRVAVRSLDAELGKLLEWLRETDLYDDAMIVVFSDHGEEFGEHGHTFHGQSVYDELVRVPLIVKYPKGRYRGQIVERPVQLIDVLPSVLEQLDIPMPRGLRVDGQSLMQKAANDLRPVFSETLKRGGNSVRSGDMKLIFRPPNEEHPGGEFQLFDLAADPMEQNPLGSDDSAEAERLKLVLVGWMQSLQQKPRVRARQKDEDMVQGELREELTALGYIQ